MPKDIKDVTPISIPCVQVWDSYVDNVPSVSQQCPANGDLIGQGKKPI